MNVYSLFINGEWVAANNGQVLQVRNPADGSILGTVPKAGADEARMAVDAAHSAFFDWSSLTAYDRSNILYTWYRYVMEQANEIGRALTEEQGKPFPEARNEVLYGASYIQWYAEEAKRIYGETIPASKSGKRITILKQPIGVVAAVTPWNFPCAMITRKLAPALAAGCTAVIKPASQTPITAILLLKYLEKAGLPKGVVNLLTGSSQKIVSEWLRDERVAKLSFTGSTEVGSDLMRQASDTIKKVSLELGGLAPAIVFEDANLDRAVEGIILSKFRNAGQTCVCVNRIYVQRSIHDAFVQRLKESLLKLKVGNGFEPDVEIGPIIDSAGYEKIDMHVRDAITNGATLMCGGRGMRGSDPDYGNYYEPTLLSNVQDHMLVMNEETFGPVAAVTVFDTEEEVICRANDTPYGLAAYFFTENASRGIRVAEALNVGIMGWNDGAPSTAEAPFGGLKQSGIGREGGRIGLEEFLETKYLSFRL